MLEREFWAPTPMPAIPLLARLREEVLRHNDGKRCPKWAFRLAEDLAVQLRPKPTLLAPRPGLPQRVLEFEGVAHHEPAGQIPSSVFRGGIGPLRERGGVWCRVKFLVTADVGDETWTFQARHTRWSR